MKKFILLCLGLALMTPLISAGTLSNTTNPIVKLEQEKPGNTFVLQLANLQQMAISIQLKDLDGNVFDEQQFSQANGRHIKYVMQAFADGTYLLTINWNDQVADWLIYKKGRQLKFKKNSGKKSAGTWLLQNAR